jgi:hypothetical protein
MYVITILGQILYMILVQRTGVLTDITSIQPILMPNGRIDFFAHNFLTEMNLINLWTGLLVYLAVKYIGGLNNVKSAIIGMLVFFLSAAVYAAMITSTWWMMDLTNNLMMF